MFETEAVRFLEQGDHLEKNLAWFGAGDHKFRLGILGAPHVSPQLLQFLAYQIHMEINIG